MLSVRFQAAVRVLPARTEDACARRTVLGIVAHDGAFAEYLALPLENLHVVPAGVTDEQAVFVEPLAAACEILEQVDAKKFRSAACGNTNRLRILAPLDRKAPLPLTANGT